MSAQTRGSMEGAVAEEECAIGATRASSGRCRRSRSGAARRTSEGGVVVVVVVVVVAAAAAAEEEAADERSWVEAR